MLQKIQAGQYQEIIDQFGKARPQSADDLAALIGSYAFLGRIEEAQALYKLHVEKMPNEKKIWCRFFLAIALTRVSRLKEARALFKANLKSATTPATLPFALQGRAFYLYFLGKFNKAARRAKRALRAAIAANDSYIHFLAMDLLGHCLVQTGRRPEGLRLLRQAAGLAKKLGNSNFADAFDVASLIYESEIGLRPQSILSEIEKALSELRINDSYTRNNLILEYARQLTLRGRWQEARSSLDRESSAIYAFANRRQELVLQLRLIEISLRQGDFFATEHFIQAAKRCLHRVADRNYEVRLLGIEMKYRRLKGLPILPDGQERLLALSKEYSTLMNQSILYRQDLGPSPEIFATKDAIGYLYQVSRDNPDVAAEGALEAGYLSLWCEFKSIAPGQRQFIVLNDQRSFVAVAPEGVIYKKGKLSRQQLKLLQCLQRGAGNKENIAALVWGYNYEPLRHDPMIYSAITKLRQLLEPYANWLVTTHMGWQLTNEVHWSLSKSIGQDQILQKFNVELPSGVEHLNSRQIQALNEIKVCGIWTIKSYKSKYKVSTMTAYRDLDGLRDLNLLVRIGEGRATRYYQPKPVKQGTSHESHWRPT